MMLPAAARPHGIEFTIVAIVVLTLAVGAAVRAFSARTKTPYTVAMLVLGLAAGFVLRVWGLGDSTLLGHLLRTGSAISADMIIFAFLPALVFESAFAMDVHSFRKNLGVVVLLAVPALLISTVAAASLVVGLTSLTALDAWRWTWPVALVFGALISATDPVAVVAILRDVGAPKRLSVLIEGESLLNDGTAIVVFTVLLGVMTGGAGATLNVGSSVLSFARVVTLGVAVGFALAFVVSRWMGRMFNQPLIEITLTLALAYACMMVAEGLLHASGVLAIVTAGLYMAGPGRRRISPEVEHFLHQFWEMLAHIANTLIFFLVGLVIVIQLTDASWRQLVLILVAWLGIVAIRFVVTFGLLPVCNRVGDTVTSAQATVMSWGGLRGAVSLALALVVSQRPDIDASLRAQILQLTGGVVLMTILVNGTTTGMVLNRLGFSAKSSGQVLTELQARAGALREVQSRLKAAAAEPDLRTVPWAPITDSIDDRVRTVESRVADVRASLSRADHNEQLSGLWQRALSMERRAYRRAFADGTLGRAAAEILERELDRHADKLQAGEYEAPIAARSASAHSRWWQFGSWIRRVFDRSGAADFDDFALHYDLSRGEARAANQVQKSLEKLRDANPEVVDEIVAAYRRYRSHAKQHLEDMRVNLPELATAVERRLAERIALNFERSALESLRRTGELESGAAAEALDSVDASMMRIQFTSKRVPLPETAELCRSSALFRGLAEETIGDLAEMTDEQVFHAGDYLFREGDHGDGMFIIARGAVQVLKGERDDVLAVLGGGDVLGEMALLTGAPRTASARAGTTVTVGRISSANFERLLKQRPKLRTRIWEAFTRNALDNETREHPAFRHLSRELRHGWAEGVPLLELRDGEHVDAQHVDWVFCATGALRAADGTQQPRLTRGRRSDMVASGDVRVVLLGPPPAAEAAE